MSDYHLIKMTNVVVRERPAFYSAPGCYEKDSEGNPLPATELWRDQRKRYVHNRWKIGVWIWEYSPTEEILGLLLDGYPTTRAFYLRDLLNDKTLSPHDYYFDAGTTCTELVVEADEWMRVFNELDVMSRYASVHEKDKSTETVIKKIC